MTPFAFTRASSPDSAVAAAHGETETKFLGGGTNLLDLMKMGVEQPSALIDINRVPLAEITEHEGGVRIGALARNTAVASHRLIRTRYPVLSQAILAGASAQIRNMATTGGNLLQRTRCYYFYDPSYRECNKRVPGSGCAALSGFNRIHAILGGSDQCVATHPSDMVVALAALGAVIQVQGSGGQRSIPMAQFYRLPGTTPNIETDLAPGELITAADLPAVPAFRSHYLKVRDRNSYAFALVSVAALLDVDASNRIREARIALGGVAPRPWRIPEAEALLKGKEANDQNYREAAEIVVRGAKPLAHNAFKVELARRGIVRALSSALAA